MVEGEKIVSRGSYGKDYIPNQEFSLRSETKGLVRVLGFYEQIYVRGFERRPDCSLFAVV